MSWRSRDSVAPAPRKRRDVERAGEAGAEEDEDVAADKGVDDHGHRREPCCRASVLVVVMLCALAGTLAGVFVVNGGRVPWLQGDGSLAGGSQRMVLRLSKSYDDRGRPVISMQQDTVDASVIEAAARRAVEGTVSLPLGVDVERQERPQRRSMPERPPADDTLDVPQLDDLLGNPAAASRTSLDRKGIDGLPSLDEDDQADVPPLLPGERLLAELEAEESAHRPELLRDAPGEDRASKCYRLYGAGLVAWWGSHAKSFCVDGAGRAALTCRSFTHPLLNAPTAPHTLCDARELLVDLSKLRGAPCFKHRPGYLCGAPTYPGLEVGALALRCMRTPEFSLDRFPRDALRDLFDALSTGAPSSDPSAEERFSGVTFLVTRERNEHANLFHALTDLLNAFIAASVLGVDPSAARVLLLDDHGASATDAAWSAAFGGQGVLRAFELQRAARNRRLRLERAVFVPPGYSSTLLAELPNKDIECGGASGLITSFADYMLSAMRVGRPSPSSNRNAGLRVLFVSRRGFARDCANEDELVAAARSIAGVSSVQVEQFGSRELREQMQVVAAHDVLVGMHGAALAHLMWLPRHGGVFELRGTSDFGFYCYGHMARWNGLLYRLLEPLEARPTALATEPYPIDRAAFVRELAALVGAVQERMRSGSLRS